MKETNISYKHHDKLVVGYSDYAATVHAWKRDFAEYFTELENGACEIKVPIDLFKQPTHLKRRVSSLTDEQKQASRERLAAMRAEKLAQEATATPVVDAPVVDAPVADAPVVDASVDTTTIATPPNPPVGF